MVLEDVHRGRVLMFTRDRSVDRRILLEADALEADGWSVMIVAWPLVRPCVAEDPRVMRLDIPGYMREGGGSALLGAYERISCFIPFNSRLMRALRSIALALIGGRPERLFINAFKSVIETMPADVFVAHDLPMLPVGVAAQQRHGGRLVYDSHELFPEQDFDALERHVWRRLEREHIGRADLVITVNPSIARLLEDSYGIGPVAVIHNAERLPESLPDCRVIHGRLGLDATARVLLFQGGLSEGRNLEVVVRALAHVRSDRLHLVFLGDGLMRDRLQQVARSCGLTERVHLLDAVPQAELLTYTASADAGVIPYRPTCLNNKYCTPNKLFEFIAAGIPIIASDLPELRRIVCGNGIGVLGDTGDERQLGKLVDDLFADADVYAGYRRAVMRARNLVNWEQESRKLVALYRPLSPRAGPAETRLSVSAMCDRSHGPPTVGA